MHTNTTDKQQLRTVIITGAGSGIGLETAKLLLETKTYRLVMVGRNKAKLEDAAHSLGGVPDLISTYSCDLGHCGQIARLIEKIEGAYKGIYGLVNNAGIYPLYGMTNTTEEVWDEAMNINLKGPFFLTKGVAATMAKNPYGGRIINISSTAGIIPNSFALAYSVAKAAMIHLTKTLAKELGKDNITVNCICPGIVRTPLHETYHGSDSELEEFYAKKGASFPLGRVGDARDVASAIKFFLGDEASWVTGDVFVIDGGRLLL